MREEVRGGRSASAGASSYTSDVHSIARGGQNSMYNVKDLKIFIDYGKYLYITLVFLLKMK